ncbi:complement related-short precursor [Strongylocentrotus purpuratus]|uniref:Uncharacterized protein n=1 Tax=Strongylocentrotus purpuratus TaxID=7668 RepID=A0A7M7NBR1_STRPU|nr:complement related-short precursor [Strongylocentrotus purpuratus]|eukprot:XP_011662483.1 PREDICTED: complement related-short precursor [Strongylocentrotus purpuratus]
MEGRRFEDIVRRLIYIQLFLTSVCVGSSPCMPESDQFGRYTVIGGGGNLWSVGVPSGSRVQASVRCDAGAMAQQSVTSQCSNGTWIPPWPRCEKPCSVLRNIGEARQFVNDKRMTSYYNRPTLPDGTQIVARCRDPGKHRLIGDQKRTCQGGQWTGVEPECQLVQAQVLFYQEDNKWRDVASNGTVVVYVQLGKPRRLDVVCRDISVWFGPPRLTTPLVNDGDLYHWHRRNSHGKRLDPVSTDFSGIYTCDGSSSSHSVHVLFKAAECDVPAAPEHGRLLDGSRQQPRDIFPSGTSVSFECEDDYSLVGSRRITCHKGEWSNDPPVCKASRCPELTIPDNAIMEGVYGYGREIQDERIFYCRTGYVLRGDTNNLRCLETGVWSDPLPTCEAVVHQVSPCASVRCESWQRCEATGPNTTICGCINPASCLTSGPTVCGTNGDYYRSECHLKAHACLHDLQLDIAETHHGCIYGVPDEDQPTIRPTPDDSPVVSSSFSSFEETLIGAQSVPTEPPHEAHMPTESAADSDSPADYNSFLSLVMVAPADDNNEDTRNSPPPPTTRTQPAGNVNETAELTPFNSTFLDPTLEALIPE